MATTPVASVATPAPANAKTKRTKKRRTVSQLASRVDTNRQGQEGVAWVSWIVEGLWGCGVEVISASNDDGVDAIIMLKRRPSVAPYGGPTGDLLFVQIKTGYVKAVPEKDYSISFDADKLASWRVKWAAYPGPAVMINVIPRRLIREKAKAAAKPNKLVTEDHDPVAYWADLKRTESFEPNKVLFELENRFDRNAKSSFFNLCWRWAEFRKLPVIQLDMAAAAFPGEKQPDYMGVAPMRDVARNYFKELKKASTAVPNPFRAQITWRGWEHITRLSRPVRTKQQSIQLLPAVARILLLNSGVEPKVARPVKPTHLMTPSNGQELRRGYETLTARVVFYERHEAVVRVILERTQLYQHGVFVRETVIFYSVYEVARRKNSP